MEVEPVPVAAAPYQHEPEPRQLEVDGEVDAVPRARRNEDFTRLDPNNTANNTCNVVVYITSASARYRGTPCMLYCEPVDELGRCTCVQFQVSGALGQGLIAGFTGPAARPGGYRGSESWGMHAVHTSLRQSATVHVRTV